LAQNLLINRQEVLKHEDKIVKVEKIVLAAALALTASTAANAGVISFSETLPDYSSPGSSSGFPIDLGTVGTFTFAAGDVLDATISGTWGNFDFPDSSAGADIFIDGLLVAQCVEFADCWQNSTGTVLWSYTFTAADLLSGILDDGIANLQIIQTSSTTVRLGDLTLSGNVDINAVPEPGTLVLAGIGLLGLGLGRRRRPGK